ncbi:LexA family protein [Agathobaculum desmolans]|uniref:LexA family protein n=1 Tax=Agathobaculum desmolans TaxID=39484 RepID=UPI00248EDBC7|nr:S24 family peptidase [Agathobaculum desmolans]
MNDYSKLTPAQKKVLDFIVEYHTSHGGVSPSFREIAKGVGLSSSSTVNYHLKNLQAEGFITSENNRWKTVAPKMKSMLVQQIPIRGDVSSGTPFMQPDDSFKAVPCTLPIHGNPDEYFAVKMHGNSMFGRGIQDGDILYVRETKEAEVGDVVIAYDNTYPERVNMKETSTGTQLFCHSHRPAVCRTLGEAGGELIFEAWNEQYMSMPYQDCEIIGVVIGLLRDFR